MIVGQCLPGTSSSLDELADKLLAQRSQRYQDRTIEKITSLVLVNPHVPSRGICMLRTGCARLNSFEPLFWVAASFAIVYSFSIARQRSTKITVGLGVLVQNRWKL